MKLLLDITNQSKLLSVIISTNILNYFNHITEIFVSAICYYFGLLMAYFITLFSVI
jgi:hypothetical protein